jgi:hypothetical protein
MIFRYVCVACDTASSTRRVCGSFLLWDIRMGPTMTLAEIGGGKQHLTTVYDRLVG